MATERKACHNSTQGNDMINYSTATLPQLRREYIKIGKQVRKAPTNWRKLLKTRDRIIREIRKRK